MKRLLFLSVLFIFVGLNTFSQEIKKLRRSVPVWKGTITMRDGNSETFRNLNLDGQDIIYRDNNGEISEKNISDVFSITRRGSYAGYGALCGSCFGMLVSLQTEKNIVMGDLQSDSNRGIVYLGLTAGCTVVGGLVGLMFKKLKTVYINQTPLTFSPSFFSTPEGNKYPMLSIRLCFD